MSRNPLKDRRFSVTVKVQHTWANGKTQKVLTTFGFDEQTGKIRELFCSDFKEGTDLHTLLMDACMTLSLLLQHGYAVDDIRNKLVPAPRSLLASLIDEAVRLEKEYDDARS